MSPNIKLWPYPRPNKNHASGPLTFPLDYKLSELFLLKGLLFLYLFLDTASSWFSLKNLVGNWDV